MVTCITADEEVWWHSCAKEEKKMLNHIWWKSIRLHKHAHKNLIGLNH